jgi:hypothetical protein
MKTVVRAALVFAVGSALAACNETEFKRSTKVAEPIPPPVAQDHVIKSMTMEESVTESPREIKSIDRLDLVIQAGDSRKLDESVSEKKQGVDLMFVLDTTGSMKDEMDAVKDGISQIADSLKTSGVDFRVGMVGFVDSYADAAARTIPLTDDIARFKLRLALISPQSNQDFPESSIYAAREAVKRLGDSSVSRPDALKVIVLIADVVGHNGSLAAGGSPVRDCSVAGLASEINAYAASLPGGMTNFKFYYSVPDPAVVDENDLNAGAFVDCTGTKNKTGYVAKVQMEEIMNSILPSVEKSKRGGALVDNAGRALWPLTQSNLVATLTPLLRVETSRMDVSGSCLATHAELFEGSKRIYQWSPKELAEVNSAFSSTNEIRLPNVLGNPATEGKRQLDLKVERCCIASEDLAASRLTSCERTFTQSIRYDVDVKRAVPGQ